MPNFFELILVKYKDKPIPAYPKWVSYALDYLPIRDHEQYCKDDPNNIEVHVYLQDLSSIKKLVNWADKHGVGLTFEGSDYHEDFITFGIRYEFTDDHIKKFDKARKRKTYVKDPLAVK